MIWPSFAARSWLVKQSVILNYRLWCEIQVQLIYQAKQLGFTMYSFPDIRPQKPWKRYFPREGGGNGIIRDTESGSGYPDLGIENKIMRRDRAGSGLKTHPVLEHWFRGFLAPTLKLTEINGLPKIFHNFRFFFGIWITRPQSTNPKYLKNAKSEHLIGWSFLNLTNEIGLFRIGC
jgi:hypothetical protein